VDPFDNEDTGANTDTRRANPSPHVAFDQRVLYESFGYDWLGNTSATGDDANGFYDRSLGAITNDSTKRYQLAGASNEATGSVRSGHLTSAYDDAGNLLSMAVSRAGTCLPTGANCGQRFVYEWDEVGQLTRARRWDLSDPGAATDDAPTGTPAVELRYAYDGGGNRVLKTAVDDANNELHTVYALGSLELRRAGFQEGDYVDDRTTEVAYLAGVARLHYSDDSLPTLSSGHLHVLFELPDHLGSSSIVVDKETSELVERSTYLAKGSADSDYRPERWESFREDHRFTGKEEDIEVGLTYFGARYYAPGLGRFVSPDPLAVHGLGADLNVYAYVSGALLSAVDPLGLEDTAPVTIAAKPGDPVNPADLPPPDPNEPQEAQAPTPTRAQAAPAPLSNQLVRAQQDAAVAAGTAAPKAMADVALNGLGVTPVKAGGRLVLGEFRFKVGLSNTSPFSARDYTLGALQGASNGVLGWGGLRPFAPSTDSAVVGQATTTSVGAGASGAGGALGGTGSAVAGAAGSEVAPVAADLADGAEGSAGDTVRYFRVQGGTPPFASRNIVHVDAANNVTFSDTTLNVSVGDAEHAQYFLLNKRPGGQIVSFEVPGWFHDLVSESAIAQKYYTTNPANQGGLAPKIVDPSTPGLSLELPPIWSQWLNEVVVPGSGRVH
jgi:RHS repeat-associated protein